jgi:phage terminase large subunit
MIASGIKIKKLPQYNVLYNLPPDVEIVICIGGRGGGKTYEVSKFIAFSSTIKNKRCVVLRDEKEIIRESILNEILLRFDSADKNGQLSMNFQRLDTGIRSRKTANMVVFTKGFRPSSNDKKANLKSISDVDIAVIEEAEDIRDEEMFNTFADGIRKVGAVIIIILNTPDINHWIVKRYFTLEDKGDGFYDIIPKQTKGVVVIKTDYTMNPYLPSNIIERYENYGNTNSVLYNPFYHKTAILGYASTGRKGQIFSGWKPCTDAQFNSVEASSVWGLDFGLSSPAGIVECKCLKDEMYIREHNYLPLTTKEIGILFCRLGVGKDLIIGDSAEPHTISKLRRGWEASELKPEEIEKYPDLLNGFYILGAIKGPDSIVSGIDLMMQTIIHVTEGSKNLWAEYANYVWELDRNKVPTGKPEDANNHLIDPSRYVRKAKGRLF